MIVTVTAGFVTAGTAQLGRVAPTRADHDPGVGYPEVVRRLRVRRGAGLRASGRVDAVIAAAITAYADHHGADGAENPTAITLTMDAAQLGRVVRAAATAAYEGVGGTMGLSLTADRGLSPRADYGGTRRPPWAQSLGTGRALANDGDAWTSALGAARYSEALGDHETPEPEDYVEAALSGLGWEHCLAQCLRDGMLAWTPEDAHAWVAAATRIAEGARLEAPPVRDSEGYALPLTPENEDAHAAVRLAASHELAAPAEDDRPSEEARRELAAQGRLTLAAIVGAS